MRRTSNAMQSKRPRHPPLCPLSSQPPITIRESSCQVKEEAKKLCRNHMSCWISQDWPRTTLFFRLQPRRAAAACGVRKVAKREGTLHTTNARCARMKVKGMCLAIALFISRYVHFTFKSTPTLLEIHHVCAHRSQRYKPQTFQNRYDPLTAAEKGSFAPIHS